MSLRNRLHHELQQVMQPEFQHIVIGTGSTVSENMKSCFILLYISKQYCRWIVIVGRKSTAKLGSGISENSKGFSCFWSRNGRYNSTFTWFSRCIHHIWWVLQTLLSTWWQHTSVVHPDGVICHGLQKVSEYIHVKVWAFLQLIIHFLF